MMSGDTASRTWVVARRSGASYTGGAIALCADGSDGEGEGLAACLCADRVALLDLATGTVARLLPEELPVREEFQRHPAACCIAPRRACRSP